MTTLIDFLEARLAEDEAAARAASQGPWKVDDPTYAEAIMGPDGYSVVSGGRWGDEAPVFETTEDALHIARHDPARVLREVAAKRAIIKAHPLDTEYDHVAACRACQWDVDCDAPRNDLEPSDCPCPTLRNLAWTWHTVEGWDKAWCPHHEEDHTEVEHEGPFRAFKRACRRCQADLGKLLKPRLDGV